MIKQVRQTHSLMLFALLMIVCGSIDAKVKVTKAAQASLSMRDNRPSSSSQPSSYILACEGHNVLVEERGGETVVLVDEDDNGNFTEDEKIDFGEISLTQVKICLADGRKPQDSQTVFTMTGGKIGTVIASGPIASDITEEEYNERVDGEGWFVRNNISINILGGTVNYINLSGGVFDGCMNYEPIAKVSIYLNGMNYTGSYAINVEAPMVDKVNKRLYNEKFSNVELVVANSNFTYPEGIPTAKTLSSMSGGAFVQSLDGKSYTAYGTVTVPEDVNISTQKVTLYDSSTAVTNSGNINITHCDGYESNYGTWTNVGSGTITTQAHNAVYEMTKERTCTEAGLAVRRCSRCGEIMSKEYTIPAFGHKIVTTPGVEATCTTYGLTEGKHCSVCGTITKEQEVTAYQHNYNPYNPLGTLFPTEKNYYCTTSNRMMRCSDCGKIKYSLVLSSAHNWGEYVKDKNGSCVAKGTKTRRCQTRNASGYQCNATETITDEDSKTGIFGSHSWGSIVRGTTPTCEKDGHDAYYKCTTCQRYYKTPLSSSLAMIAASPVTRSATGHNFTAEVASDAHLVSHANCTEGDKYYISCTKCSKDNPYGDYFYGSDPLGHNFEISDIHPNDEVPETGVLDLHCLRCDETKENFSFSRSKTRSANSQTSYKTMLTNVIERPTCQPGWGEYSLTLNYNGQTLTDTYEASIIPIPAMDEEGNYLFDSDDNPIYNIHAWTANGKCPYHEDEPAIAGYIRYVAQEVFDDDYIYKYETGKSFANVDDMLRSDIGDWGNAESYEAKAFNYTLQDGKEFSNIINNVVSVNTFDYNRAVVGGRIVTFSLPADVPTSCVNGTVYKLTNFDQENQRLVFEEYTESDIEPYTPYLVQLNNDATTLISGPVGPVTLGPTTDAPYAVYVMDSQSGWQVCRHLSTYSTYIIPEGSQWYSYYGYDATDGAFVKANSGTVRPFRTVFEINNDFLNMTNNAAPRLGLMLNDTDGATSIIAVDADKLGAEGSEIYDLTGKKAAMPLHGHIYIINGKKQIK